MKSNIIKSIVIALFCVWFSSCDDSFLDRQPTGEISTDVFWTQEKDGIQATNACYSKLRDITSIFSWEGCSDNACTAQNFIDEYMVAGGSFTSALGWVRWVWNDNYSCIRRANEVIAHIYDIPDMNKNLQDRLKGEALVIRAYSYNTLTSLYGDVPFITEPITLIDDSKKPRESKTLIVESIMKDLDEAAGYLPIQYENGSDKGRITKGAALSLKARIALFHGYYAEARSAAAEVMKPEYDYRLLDDYEAVFTYENQMNEEVILDLQYMPDLITHNSFRRMGPRSALGESLFVPTQALVDSYEANDPRLQKTMLLPGDENPYVGGIFNPAPGSGTLDEISSSYHATATGYQFKKYVLKEDADFPDRCNINIILMRYAEVLLTFAEAENELNGPTAEAYNAINTIRRRARMDTETLPDLTGLTKEQLKVAIQKERRIELAGEGLRYFDILRWRIAESVMNGMVYGMDYEEAGTGEKKTVVVGNRVFNKDKNYLWPIPEAELRLNPELAGHQNPGY